MSGLHTLTRALRHALDDGLIPMAVVGIDVSFNEDIDNVFRPHWMLHPRVFIPRRRSLMPDKALREQFRPSELIARPLKIALFDGDLAGIAYGMKAQFERRQSYRQTKATAEGTRRCRNTRGRPLRGVEAVELALFLDRVGLRRRLILHGTVLAHSLDGTVVIRPDRRLREGGPVRGR